MPLTVSRADAEVRSGPLSYRPGRAMACPACGERQWLVGRMVAECAGCETALPIEAGYRRWSGIAAAPDPLDRFPIA